MTRAAKLALRKFLYAVAGIALPIGVFLARGLMGAGETSMVVIGFLSLLALFVGTAIFVWALFYWRPKCPGCASRARFVRERDAMRLRCDACGLDEDTDWGYGD